MKKFIWLGLAIIALTSLGLILLVSKILFSLPGLMLISVVMAVFLSPNRKGSNSVEKEAGHV